MQTPKNPIARKDGLILHETPEEVLVYDLNTEKAHCLNQTAAFVWKSCDGENTVTDITRLFVDRTGSQINEDLIWLAIDQLSDKDLLENKPAPRFKGQSRREVIRRIGLAAAVALPLVASLTVPSSISAASCMCGAPGDCLTQPSCPSTVNCNGAMMCAP